MRRAAMLCSVQRRTLILLAVLVGLPLAAAAYLHFTPLALADLIGLDTCVSIMEVLRDGLGDAKYEPCPLLREHVAAVAAVEREVVVLPD